MSGPRVTSGEESKQDYSSPSDFMTAVVRRFGPISFDLAAHSGNKQHPRYFAPAEFVVKGTADELGIDPLIAIEGRCKLYSHFDEITGTVTKFLKKDKKKGILFESRTPNRDPEAFALDAFNHSWADLSKRFAGENPKGQGGFLYLNCEFSDIDPWASRFKNEMKLGANGGLLTPLTCAGWYRDNIAGVADVYELDGRLMFDGKNVFPKDCQFSHFHPEARGDKFLWDWKKDVLHRQWKQVFRP